MKRLLPLLLLAVTPLLAEKVTLKQNAILKGERTLISLKAGTVVEVVSRDRFELTVKYNNVTGTIPSAKLEEPTEAQLAAAAKAAEVKPVARKAPEPAKAPAPAKAPEAVPAPTAETTPAPAAGAQTNYGKAVRRAKASAAAHDTNLAKPADEAAK
jgi:hypothetical protein